jgi:hypothetical protein
MPRLAQAEELVQLFLTDRKVAGTDAQTHTHTHTHACTQLAIYTCIMHTASHIHQPHVMFLLQVAKKLSDVMLIAARSYDEGYQWSPGFDVLKHSSAIRQGRGDIVIHNGQY